MKQAISNQQLLSRRQVASRLGICLFTLDKIIASKGLRSLRIGKRRLFTEEAIVDFIKQQEKSASR